MKTKYKIPMWEVCVLLCLMALTIQFPAIAHARVCELLFMPSGRLHLGGGVSGEAVLTRAEDGDLIVIKRYYLADQLASDVAILNRLASVARSPEDFHIVEILGVEGRFLRTRAVNGASLDKRMNDHRIAALYRERLARLASSLQQIGISVRFQDPDTLVGGWKEGLSPRLIMIKPDNVILGSDGEMTIVDPY